MNKPEILPFIYDVSVLNDISPEFVFPMTPEIKAQLENYEEIISLNLQDERENIPTQNFKDINFDSVMPYFETQSNLYDGMIVCVQDDDTNAKVKRHFFVYLNDYGYKGVTYLTPNKTQIDEETYIRLAETKAINGNDYELLHLLYEYPFYIGTILFVINQGRKLSSLYETDNTWREMQDRSYNNRMDYLVSCLNESVFYGFIETKKEIDSASELLTEEIKSVYPDHYDISTEKIIKIFIKNGEDKAVIKIIKNSVYIYATYGMGKRLMNMVANYLISNDNMESIRPYPDHLHETPKNIIEKINSGEQAAMGQMVEQTKPVEPIIPETTLTPEISPEAIADITNPVVQEEVKVQVDEQIKQALTETGDDEIARLLAEQEQAIKDAMEMDTKNKQKSETHKLNNPVSLSKEEIKNKKTKAIFTQTPEKVVISAPKITAEKIKKATEKKKEIEKIGNSLYVPPDWDYVYTIAETSRAEDKNNGIFGLGYNKEITNEEFNAYFIAHPEYDSIMQQVIGFISYTDTELIKKGLLFYGPKEKKIKYRYEYLYGNGYDLLDQLEAYKDEVISKYGQDVYDNQIQAIKEVIPEPKSILSPDERKVPYIHPLDDLVVNFKIKQAGDISFTYAELKKRAAKKQAQAQISAAQQEEFGVEDLDTKQELSMVVFFQAYLKTMEGYLARYDLRDLTIVVDSYFGSLSLKSYREYLVTKGIMPRQTLERITNIESMLKGRLTDKKSKKTSRVTLTQDERDNLTSELDQLTDQYDCSESDFMEVKENVRKYTEDMFQRFLKEGLSYDDQIRFDYEFNKTYNGVIRVDDQYKITEWNDKLKNPAISDEERQVIENVITRLPSVKKFPVFIRHSKYFKQRSKAAKFKLTQEQVDGIKFGTINNASIIAHEVGYGKSSLAVCYTSHLFETNQLNNMLFVVPKALYDNRKWEEELVGYFDDKRNDQTIGLIPQYNFVTLGNMTTTTVFGQEGIGGLKTYDKTDLKKINQYYEFIEEIGGKVRGRRQTKTGKGALPDSINFILALKFWVKMVDELQQMDNSLFMRCAGVDKDYYFKLIQLYFGYSQTNKDLKDQLSLMDSIIMLKFLNEMWEDTYPGIPFDMNGSYEQRKMYYDFKKAEIGKVKRELANSLNLFSYGDEAIINQNIDEFEKKFNDKENKDVASNYIVDQLADIHSWLNGVLVKMYEFGIYEYGNWNFNIKDKNIFLATRDALNYMGFSYKNIEALKEIVRKVTEYPLEDTSVEISEVKYMDASTGEMKVAKTTTQKDLFRQQQDMIDKITENMTEESATGKFFLENLGIDGLVVDEAHIAKKLFTGIKTQRSVDILQPDGRLIKVTTNSHAVRGGGIPLRSLTVFGVCNYIKSLPGKKPIMLLSATPFTNQPTEIFSMLSLIGADQLRQYGIYNIKRFFDMFLKETLKYDFDHLGNFVKKVVVEDFRNKDILSNIIWSCLDIKRERQEEIKTSKLTQALLSKDEAMAAKPKRVVIPTFKKVEEAIKEEKEKIEQVSISQVDTTAGVDNNDELDAVTTLAELDRYDVSVSSIVDRNKYQIQIMENIEKWLLDEISFDSVCPNFKLFTDLSIQESEQDIDIEQDVIASGKKSRSKKKADDDVEEVTVTVRDSGNKRDGKTFKALGITRALCLSPYLFKCAATEGELPYPTPENLIKYSPKIEYVVKAIESVVRHHKVVVPREIAKSKAKIDQLNKKINLTPKEQEELDNEKINLIRYENATEVSGQVIYMSFGMKFFYTYRKNGKIVQDEFSIPTLIKQYLVGKGVFDEKEIAIFDSSTGREKRERAIKDFQDGKAKIFIGSPAMKEGVDLQNKGATMYILTPDWNPTDMRQIEGRIWRRGNEYGFVRVVYVLLDNSVEVFIYGKLEEKARRLAKLMKERNTIAELQEMSLDPNQTKVALTSDPARRADMITKIKELVLTDQLAQINKNKVNTFAIIDGFQDLKDSIEELKLVWMDYNDLYPTITENYYKWVLKTQVEIMQNDYGKYVKDSFARKEKVRADFPYPIIANWADISNMNNYSASFLKYDKKYAIEDRFNVTIWLIDNYKNEVRKDKTIEGISINEVNNRMRAKVFQRIVKDTSLNLNSLDRNKWDWVLGYNLDNEEERVKFSTEADKTDFWKSGLFMTLDNILSNVTGYDIRASEATWIGNLLFAISPFKPIPLLTSSDEIIDYAKETFRKIIDLVKTAGGGLLSEGLMEEQKIMQAGDDFIMGINALSEKIVVDEKGFNIDTNSRVRRAKENIYKQISVADFEALPVNSQINTLYDMFKELKERIGTFRGYSEDTQGKITVGTMGRPFYEEIVVAMQLNEMPKKGKEPQNYQALIEAVDKIKTYSYKIRDIERDVLRPRGLTISDLDSVKREIENDYNKIKNKIEEVKKLKVELREKYETLKQMKQDVKTEDIVEQFSLTNHYLNYKVISNEKN